MITLHYIVIHLAGRLCLAGFEEVSYHAVSSMPYGKSHKARRWGCNSQQGNGALSLAALKELNSVNNQIELESRSISSQASDETAAPTDTMIAAFWDFQAQDLTKLCSDTWGTEIVR